MTKPSLNADKALWIDYAESLEKEIVDLKYSIQTLRNLEEARKKNEGLIDSYRGDWQGQL